MQFETLNKKTIKMKAVKKPINVFTPPTRLFYYPSDFVLVVLAISFGLLLFTFSLYLILKLMSLDIFDKKEEQEFNSIDSLEDLEDLEEVDIQEDVSKEEEKTS